MSHNALALALTLSLSAPVIAAAQAVEPAPPAPVIVEVAPPSYVLPNIDPKYKEPADFGEAYNAIVNAIGLYQTKYWMGLALAISQLLIFIMKRVSATSPKVKQYGTYIIMGLSAAAAMLALLVGGMSWPSAVVVFVATVLPKFIADFMHVVGLVQHKRNPDGSLATE